jgi:hypothetical protein
MRNFSRLMANEADTCRKYVVPRLQAAGWEEMPHSIHEQCHFTAGRIVVAGRSATRQRRRHSPRDGDVSRNRVPSRSREEIAGGERSPDPAGARTHPHLGPRAHDRGRPRVAVLGGRHPPPRRDPPLFRSAKEWNANRLLERVGEVGSGAAFKRLGYLAETLLSGESVLVNAALARRSAGVVKLDPAVEGCGRLTKRWGLWVNVRLDASPADT